MGFGFNLFFILVLVPLTGILLLVWLISRSKYVGIAIGLLWTAVIGLVVLSTIMQAITAKKVLKKTDYYGNYIIDRSMFPGPNADWQYNSFRFEVTGDDSMHFHVTDGKRVIRTYAGRISTVKPYGSERLVIHMSPPTHHVLSGNPTIYRDSWSFFLVFHSPHYHNMYFIKGKWKPLDD